MKKWTNSIIAICLIVFGIILGLNAFGVTSINIFFDGWWTLIIIIPSLIGFIEDRDTGNLILFIVGILLFLNARGIYALNVLWKLILPAALVLLGIIIFKNEVLDKNANKVFNTEKKEKILLSSIFSTKNDVIKKEFKAANIEAIFGDNSLDLRNLKVNEEIYIKTLALFGEVKIYTPENVNVKINSSSFFGSIENKKQNEEKENISTININASAIFGDIRII